MPDMVDQIPGTPSPCWRRPPCWPPRSPDHDATWNKVSDWFDLDHPEKRPPREELNKVIGEHQKRSALHRVGRPARVVRMDVPLRSEGYHAMLPSLAQFRSSRRCWP